MILHLNDIVTDSQMTYIVTGWLDNKEMDADTQKIVREGVVVYVKKERYTVIMEYEGRYYVCNVTRFQV